MEKQTSSSSDEKRAEIMYKMNRTLEAGAQLVQMVTHGMYTGSVTEKELNHTLDSIEEATNTIQETISTLRWLAK